MNTLLIPYPSQKITTAKAVEIEDQFPKRGGVWATAQARAIAAGRPVWKKKEPVAAAGPAAGTPAGAVAEDEEEGEEDEEEGEDEEATAEPLNTFPFGNAEDEEPAVGELYGEEYELAPDASSSLNLSWGSSDREMSHYSHRDASGVGLTSNLQRALGLPVEELGGRAGPGLGGGGGGGLGGAAGAVAGAGVGGGAGGGAGAVAGEEGEPDVGELSVPTQDWELAYTKGEEFPW